VPISGRSTALSDANHDPDPLEHFFDEGLIDRVIRPIKSGKEASVHLCRANPRTTGEELVALKLYHPLNRRDFRDETMYRDGEWIKERRIRVALEKKTRFGREVQGMIWVDREWETLRALSEGGVPAPRPIERTGEAILMTYIGDEDLAAPQLRSRAPADRHETRALLDQVLGAIQRMLFLNVVHGDLSPYNLLLWEGQVTVIDVPQAVDPRKNRHARSFLERDIERVCDWASSHGVEESAARLAADYWISWEFADLIPEELRGLTM
jgi:RIO kinase 1